MSNLDGFRNARVHLAGLYRDKATELAEAVCTDPAGNHYGAFTACSIAWGALVDIENAIRAEVLAGDPIDNYYRRGATEDGSNG